VPYNTGSNSMSVWCLGLRGVDMTSVMSCVA
jgi:hypothetical protein